MNRFNKTRRAYLGTALAALAMSAGTIVAAAPAAAQAARPSETLNLSQNTGTLVRLTSPMSDLFVANDAIADVQVRSSTQLYVFGKSAGETTPLCGCSHRTSASNPWIVVVAKDMIG